MNDLERCTQERTYTSELLRKSVRDLSAPLATQDNPLMQWQESAYQTGRAEYLGGGRGWKLVELGNGKQWLTDGIKGINPDSIPIVLGAINGALAAIRYAKAHPEETLAEAMLDKEVENALVQALERTKRLEGRDETVDR
jgi:hypothetical protein